MQAFLSRLHTPSEGPDLGTDSYDASMKPLLIDMGVHVLSEAEDARFEVSLVQICTERMLPQAALATSQGLRTLGKLGKGFFDAPMALQAYTEASAREGPARRHVVLVFCTMQGYNDVFSFNEALAQQALVLYCACVRQTLDKTFGYECQELEGTFMLAFSEAHEAITFALVLQLMLLQVRGLKGCGWRGGDY